MQRSDSSIRWTLRMLGLGLGILVGITAGHWLSLASDRRDATAALVTIAVAIGTIGYLLGPNLSWKLLGNIRSGITQASTTDIVAIAAGMLFGAVIALALAIPLSFLPDPLGIFLPITVAVATCGLGVFVTLTRKQDLIVPLLRDRRTAAASNSLSSAETLIVDTNVLIDGRIVDVVKSGFLSQKVVVPRFVLDELQRIADSDDHLRRARGRRGLEVLNELKQLRDSLDIIEDPVIRERDVDAKLVRLALDHRYRILTNDFNLQRVATAQDVVALNLNELSNALRPMVLPGEVISLTVLQEGREAGQGVGFLDDGTMVVIDGGRTLVGQSVPVTVTRLLQTGAGRMVFATPAHAA